MPGPQREARFDFRKGNQSAFSQDVTDHYELRATKNGRMGQPGAISKVAGSQRIHLTAIGGGAAVLGLHQWQPALGRQVVAISNGNLYHKLQAATDFTQVASAFSTTVRPSFAQHVIAGTPTLYIADGTLRKFDGAAVTAAGGSPPNAIRIRTYKGRMYAIDGTKTVYWSRVANPEYWTLPYGGQADVDTYDASGLIALEKIGSSLLLFKGNSIARYTGGTQDDIRIDKETEGVSNEVGDIAPGTVVPFGDVIIFVSDRGAYVATEGGVKAVGDKIKNALDAADFANLPNAVAVPMKERNELWLVYPPSGASTNTYGYLLNVQQAAWTGPLIPPFAVCSAATHEKDDQTKTILLGGYDGFVRNGDVPAVGAKHDVLAAGTGGTAITMDIEFPTLMFGDPTKTKRFYDDQQVEADLGASGVLQIIFASDVTGDTFTTTIASAGAGVKGYTFKIPKMFKRGTLTLREATSNIVQINGLTLFASSFWR